MKELTLNTPAPTASRSSAIDRWGRRAIFKRLNGLREGQILLEENGQLRRLGNDGDLTATVRVHSPSFFRHVALGGELGAAESFIDGSWSAEDLPALLLAEAMRDVPGTALTAVTTIAAMAINTAAITGRELASPALQRAQADAHPLCHPPCRGTGGHSAIQDL